MNHVGVEQTFTAAGRRYRLGRLTRGVVRAWLEWADALVPSALALAQKHVHDFPCPDLLVDVADGLAAVRRTPDDDSVSDVEQTLEGQFRLFLLLMQKHHWDVSEDELWWLWRGLEDWPALLVRAAGVCKTDEADVERNYYIEVNLLPNYPGGASTAQSWAEIDRNIFTNCYLRPQDVDDMTLPELLTVLQAEKKAQGVVGSVASMAANSVTRLYHHLTPQQKLELSARKHGF